MLIIIIRIVYSNISLADRTDLNRKHNNTINTLTLQYIIIIYTYIIILSSNNIILCAQNFGVGNIKTTLK